MHDSHSEDLGPGPVDPRMVAYTAISDLFFNTDHENAKRYDGKGDLRGYDPEEMRSNALVFLENLAILGVRPLPTVESLLDDYYGRV